MPSNAEAVAAAIVILVVACVLIWRLLDTISDAIKWLGKVTDVFARTLPGLTQPQRFNVLIDIVVAIVVAWIAYLLREAPGFAFSTFIIFALIVGVCLGVAFGRAFTKKKAGD